MMKFKLPFVLSAAVSTAALVYANIDGPPVGHTGAPGEATRGISGCHDTPPGGVILSWDSGPPHMDTVYYIFAARHFIPSWVSLSWGFQLAILDSLGEPFGEIVRTDTIRTQLITDAGGRTYLSQTAAGALPDSTCGNCASWNFRWVRPPDAATTDHLYFYIAAVAGDGDGAPDGDAVGDTLAVGPFCPVRLTGDVAPTNKGTVNSSDIIWLVSYIFRSGIQPHPCIAAGDANCDVRVTSSDVIYLVNYVFKGGPAPCDVCPLVIDGTWDDCY